MNDTSATRLGPGLADYLRCGIDAGAAGIVGAAEGAVAVAGLSSVGGGRGAPRPAPLGTPSGRAIAMAAGAAAGGYRSFTNALENSEACRAVHAHHVAPVCPELLRAEGVTTAGTATCPPPPADACVPRAVGSRWDRWRVPIQVAEMQRRARVVQRDWNNQTAYNLYNIQVGSISFGPDELGYLFAHGRITDNLVWWYTEDQRGSDMQILQSIMVASFVQLRREGSDRAPIDPSWFGICPLAWTGSLHEPLP